MVPPLFPDGGAMKNFLISSLVSFSTLFFSGCGVDKFFNKLVEAPPEKRETTLQYGVLNASPANTSHFGIGKDKSMDPTNAGDGIELRVLAEWDFATQSCGGGMTSLVKPLTTALSSGSIVADYTIEEMPSASSFVIRVYNNINRSLGYQLVGNDQRGVYLDSADNSTFPRLSSISEIAPSHHRLVTVFHQDRSLKIKLDGVQSLLEGRVVSRASSRAPSISFDAHINATGVKQRNVCQSQQLIVKLHSLKISSEEATLP